MRPAWRLTLIAILLAAFGLRVYRLDTPELGGDEAFGCFFALRPYPGIVQATLSLREPHPVAGYLVQKAWSGLAGDGDSPAFEPMLRRSLSAFLVGDAARPNEQMLLAVLGGLLALISVARLGTEGLCGRRIALLVLCLGMPVVGTWLSAQSRPIVNERYLVAAVPAYYC